MRKLCHFKGITRYASKMARMPKLHIIFTKMAHRISPFQQTWGLGVLKPQFFIFFFFLFFNFWNARTSTILDGLRLSLQESRLHKEFHWANIRGNKHQMKKYGSSDFGLPSKMIKFNIWNIQEMNVKMTFCCTKLNLDEGLDFSILDYDLL